MISCSVALIGSLLCCLVQAIFGDAPACLSEFYPSYKQRCRLSVRHIEGGGIGYNKGYTTFEGFFAPHLDPLTVMPFLDLRGHAFNNGRMATNVGVGLRKILGNRVYGVNIYYDYRSADYLNANKIHYNQVGFGFETVGAFWEFRVNGYLPVGKTSRHQTQLAGFSGHYLMLSKQYQFAMSGASAEVGFHFGRRARYWDFYAAAGPYCFVGKIGSPIWGGKGRLVCRFKDYVTLELSNSYDKMFRNRLQFQLTLTVPFGGGSHKEQDDCMFSRMVQPVERQEILVVGCGEQRNPAIDSTTGAPFNFVFVDNTSHSDGTYVSPYPTLALAEANSTIGDIIYVFPGDGTTKGMGEGITLQRNQRLWGSGVSHLLQTAQGDFTIPALSSSAPQITNRDVDTNGDGITLASINEVSGITVANAMLNGMSGTNCKDIQISNCTIQDNTQDALNISCADQATVKVQNNYTTRNEGACVFSFEGAGALSFSGNTCHDNFSISSPPLIIIAGTSPLSATITNNSFTENICGAISCVLNNTSNAQLIVSDNTIANNGSGSLASLGSAFVINPSTSASGNCFLQLTNNNFSGNAAAALYCSNGNFNEFQVTVDRNMIADNGSGLVFANGCNAFGLVATGNVISNGGDHGITTAGGIIMTTAQMTITDNQITGNTNLASGIALSHAGTDLNFVATGNDMSDNESSGIVMYSSGIIGNMVINIANNTINNNQNLNLNASGGIDLEQFANLACTLTNNRLSNNATTGIFIGSTDPTASACVSMSGNESNTGYTVSNDTGTFNLAPCDVDTVNTGVITTLGTITAVQSCPSALPCAVSE